MAPHPDDLIADHTARVADRTAHFAENRANWDDRAAFHEASGYGIAELLASPDAITQEVSQDAGRLGDLAGLDVIHLQCHLGLDTVSLSRLGAVRVVGLDISPESLRRARSLAARAGVDVELVEANVYDARTAVAGSFDIVYTTLGVLCWLPDIEAWARVVASLLRPGGRLLLRDDHPAFMAVGDDVAHGLTLHEPYFQQPEPMTWEDDGSYVTVPDGTAPIAHTRSHQWNHAVGEILTALLRAGLVLDEVAETRVSAWCRWPDLMEPCEEGYRFADPATREMLPPHTGRLPARPLVTAAPARPLADRLTARLLVDRRLMALPARRLTARRGGREKSASLVTCSSRFPSPRRHPTSPTAPSRRLWPPPSGSCANPAFPTRRRPCSRPSRENGRR